MVYKPAVVRRKYIQSYVSDVLGDRLLTYSNAVVAKTLSFTAE